MFISCSAWISKQNIYSYLEFKSKFVHKNKTSNFQKAIKEIENDMNHANEISLKGMSMNSILSTFEENVPSLKSIYDTRATKLNRFNEGNNFLTILHRTVTSEQQQHMYTRIRHEFAEDERKYMENPTVSLKNCSKFEF